ncbi:MAG: cytochrome c [Acidobacteriales bacterium]|nr:cytochrome c [Terriglobales bacterium]
MKLCVREVLLLICLVLLIGCHRRIGAPEDREELLRPEKVVSFDRLYKANCSACHGENGVGGPAIDLSNPNYQALVDDASMRRWITSGMPGTQMPAFGISAGGFLTPEQVDALITGMRSRWSTQIGVKQDMPPYRATGAGNADRGNELFRSTCSRCHQQSSQKVADPSYLSLVSDQSLRAIVIAGRRDLGHPDWVQVRHNQPLTDQDVSDVVAYLNSLRNDTPGEPYSDTKSKR